MPKYNKTPSFEWPFFEDFKQRQKGHAHAKIYGILSGSLFTPDFFGVCARSLLISSFLRSNRKIS